MNLKTKFTGIIRYFSLIFISFIAYPLAGQQAGSAPVITLISPSAVDSLNNSGRIIVSAEIVSNSPLQTFRIMHNETVFASETMITLKQKDDNTYIMESLVPLTRGLNTVFIEAKNSAGTAVSEKRIINYRLEPFITWLIPDASGTTVTFGTMNINAEIKTGLPLQNISINLNGTMSAPGRASAKPLNDDTYVLETTIELKPGKNNIYISADNTRGETRSVPRTITFNAAPVITIVSPSPRDSINNSGTVVVSAEIVSHRALQTFRIMHNEVMFASETMIKPKQKDSITYIIESLVPLKGGLNTIYLEARNSAGAVVSEKRVINYHNEPFVTWITPAPVTSTVESGNLNIKAEIKTVYPLQRVTINLNGNVSGDEKSAISKLNDDTYLFEKSVKLNPGRNTIFISAGNTKGDYRSASRSITFGSPPVVTLLSPTPADSLNTSGMILVRAEIISSVGIQLFRIIHNGSTVINESGTKPIQKDSSTYIIESLVSIDGGLNMIYVEAKNALGTKSSEKRTVTGQSQPFITWILPESVTTTTESGTLNVNAEIKTSFELQNVSLNLNGKIFDGEPADIMRLNNETYIFKKTIPNILSAKNTVFISATNIRGTTTSDPRSISYAAGSRPVITIAATDSLNNSGILLFSAEIISQTKIQAVRLIHNGTVVVTETTKNPEQKDSITYIVKGLFPLRAGLNTIYLEAKNTIGTTSSERRNIICQPAPIIRWISPSAASSTAGSEILKIKAEITTNFDLLNAGVNINGTVIADPKEGITRVNNDTYALERIVSLKSGENNIFLVADNARGTGNSTRRTVSYTPGIISEIKWITPAEVSSDTRKAEFPVSASIITRSDIKNLRLYINGTEVSAGDMANTTTKKNTQEYLYNNIIILKPGANTIELSAITAQGTVTTDKRTINYSAPVRPILAWQNPVANTSEVNQASVDIRMNIKSADDLNNLTVYLNGKALDNINLQNSIRKENEEYVLGNTVVLKPGDNSLYVSAGNIAGLTTSETRNIKYTVLSIPVIAWSNPETAVSSLVTPAITLTANITSTTELKDLKVYQNGNSLPVNPAVSTTDKQQGVYHIEQAVNLSQGENRIYITARNIAGNATSETRSISYMAPVAPVITWIAPSRSPSEINLPAADIRATVKSTDKLQSVMVYINGVGSEEVNQVVPTETPGEYLFRKTINLQPADNTLYLSATNSAGSVRSEDRLLRNPPPSKPVITWAVPANNTSVNTDMIVVEACIKSGSPLKEAQIWVNSSQWASETVFQATQQEDCTYRFTKPVLLKEGDNNVFITAINAAGSEMSERRTIRFQKGIAERRLALVIGNAKYANSAELKNPVNDANIMDATLRSLDFEVIKNLNATKAEMEKAIRQFSEKLRDYNVALFYYAGHGIQVGGENYLIPVDAVLDKESDCQWDAIHVNNMIVRQFEQVPENINIIILDACRDNPFKSWSRGAPQGFKMLSTVSGTFVAFATLEGTTAADGQGANGTYTEELVKQMIVPQPIFNVFTQTSNQVKKRTNNRQQPQISSSLTGDFWFKR